MFLQAANVVGPAIALLSASVAAGSGQCTHHEEVTSMTNHKFKVGQNVLINRPGYDSLRHTAFLVVRHLPQAQGVNQYRIKSVADGRERVVIESELVSE
jgi:hypothetical protein